MAALAAHLTAHRWHVVWLHHYGVWWCHIGPLSVALHRQAHLTARLRAAGLAVHSAFRGAGEAFVPHVTLLQLTAEMA